MHRFCGGGYTPRQDLNTFNFLGESWIHVTRTANTGGRTMRSTSTNVALPAGSFETVGGATHSPAGPPRPEQLGLGPSPVLGPAAHRTPRIRHLCTGRPRRPARFGRVHGSVVPIPVRALPCSDGPRRHPAGARSRVWPGRAALVRGRQQRQALGSQRRCQAPVRPTTRAPGAHVAPIPPD